MYDTMEAIKIEQPEHVKHYHRSRGKIAWLNNINFEGDSQCCRKSLENFECPRNRGASSREEKNVGKRGGRGGDGRLRRGMHQGHHGFLLLLLIHSALHLLLLLFSIFRDNDTYTLPLGNNINGLVYRRARSVGPLTKRGENASYA